MHGWGISLRIQQISEDVLQINQGSLYPALHRLEQQGLIEAEWGDSETTVRPSSISSRARAGSSSPRKRATGSACPAPSPVCWLASNPAL